jgi:molybdenum cofactor guanylyltransferase
LVDDCQFIGSESTKLPIHGFVLAGGRSTRMGRDKALLPFRGTPMVNIAVSALAAVCEHVSIAGNRDDLAMFATVVHESRSGEGPVAGIEAGLQWSDSQWAMFVPVDVPLLTPLFLRAWAARVLARPATRVSYVSRGAEPHPALCLLRKECLGEVSKSIDAGERRVQDVLNGLDGLWIADVAKFADPEKSRHYLTNINTRDDLAIAEKS